jgi:hypothetical protein
MDPQLGNFEEKEEY